MKNSDITKREEKEKKRKKGGKENNKRQKGLGNTDDKGRKRKARTNQ